MCLISRFVVVGLVAGGLSVIAPGASVAAGQLITVNTLKDLVDGTDGRCSLREALNAAAGNASSGNAKGECTAGDGAGEDVVKLKGDTTYKLTRDGATDENANADGDLDVVSGAVKIQGRRGTVIVQRDTDQRVIDVHSALALERVKITGGRPQPAGNGGGIRNVGTLSLWKTTVSGNVAGSPPAGSGLFGGDGGGIYSRGTLVVEFSKITNNSAGNGASKGLSAGATPGGGGGGIYNAGTARIEDSKLLNNRSGNGGHGTSRGVTVGTVGAAGGSGGALATAANTTATIERSTLAGNRSGDGGAGGRGFPALGGGEGGRGAAGGDAGEGGAVYVGSGSADIEDSTISGNRTGEPGSGGPGGFGSPSGQPGQPGSHGMGGGVMNDGEPLLMNVTISGNKSGAGGGIASKNDFQLNNVTIARNTALVGEGGGVHIGGGDFLLLNTLIADNHALYAPDCFGTLSPDPVYNRTDHYNLVENPFGCDGIKLDHSTTDIFFVDPRLAALDANGGPTRTHALRKGSRAINAGNSTPSNAEYPDNLFSCTANDQRGKPRNDCDIGAYERV